MNNASARPTVWVVKEQALRGPTGPAPMDYTPAYKYGDVQFITDCDLPLTRGTSGLKDLWTQQVKKFHRVYNPDRDYIVLTGSPLAIFLIGAIIGAINSTYRPKILVWRRESNEYVPFDSIKLFEHEAIASTRD